MSRCGSHRDCPAKERRQPCQYEVEEQEEGQEVGDP